MLPSPVCAKPRPISVRSLTESSSPRTTSRRPAGAGRDFVVQPGSGASPGCGAGELLAGCAEHGVINASAAPQKSLRVGGVYFGWSPVLAR